MYTARIAACLVALAVASCAVFLGLDDHEPYPIDAGNAPDSASDVASCDTEKDPQNCGACGVRCGAGYACMEGVCGNRVDAVGAGNHACVLLHAGEVWCWGPNTLSQLGPRPAICSTCPAPARVNGLSSVVELSVGLNTTCVRRQDGSVLCWGEAGAGQLGPDAGVTPCGANPTPCTATPQTIPLPRAAKQVATGAGYACALLDDGSTYCWGDDTYGELGNGAVGPPRGTPVEVTITKDVAEIAAGRGVTTTCATKLDGTIWCWGENFRGMLGHATGTDPQCNVPTGGTIACNATPAPIASFSGFSQPTASFIACANGGTKGVYCWGFNGNGQLGLGTIDTAEHPTPAPILVTTPVRVAPGVRHACALDANGQVSCWGFNFWGTAGDGTINGPVACEGGQMYCQPQASHVVGLPKIVALSSGMDLTVALGADGTVWAWGDNRDGRIGHQPGQADGGANDVSCYVVDAGGGGPCSPTPARVYGLP